MNNQEGTRGFYEQLRLLSEQGLDEMFGDLPGEATPRFASPLLRHLIITVCKKENRGFGPDTRRGIEFRNDVFELHPYDDERPDRPNFKCGGIEVRWHGSIDRILTIRPRLHEKDFAAVIERCIRSLTS